MIKYCFLFLTCSIAFTIARTQTGLPAFFSDGMVLQQQQEVSIWGTDSPGKRITVTGSWGKTASATTSGNGEWKLKIKTLAAGGPYQLKIKGTNEILLKNVLFGEVWLCSGQSNMQMPLKGNVNQPVIGSNEAILHSANDKIRFYNAIHASSITPAKDAKGQWRTADPSTTGDCSAVAYFFAKQLQGVLGVPVGLIHTSWGASTIESWMDPGSLSAFKNVVIPRQLPEKEPNKTPTILYNAMLSPFIGYGIKGVIWYQGESNRVNAGEYADMLTTMIRSWRAQWQQGNFPFYFVQIAPFDYKDGNAAFLREAQLKTMLTVENTGMAVTLDLGEKNLIHPGRKNEVGKRLAYWALAKTYQKKGVGFSGPVYREMQLTETGKAVISFDHAPMGLTSFGGPLTGFEMAGEDKVFYPAHAAVNPDKAGSIIVSCEQVKKPLSVRYAFKSWTEASLFNTEGLPASSFRTDNW